MKSFFNNLLSRLRGTKTYIFSTFITGVALFGMYSGKLDFAAGIEIISTAGIGAFLRSAVNTQAPPNFDPAPPAPIPAIVPVPVPAAVVVTTDKAD